MTPSPEKTKPERANEFDVSAKLAFDRADYVFAKTLSDYAHKLRMEDQMERKHDQLKKN